MNSFKIVKFISMTCDENDSDGFCNINTWKQHDAKYDIIEDQGNCNIERVNHITNEEFLTNYAYNKPVIISTENSNEYFKQLCERYQLLKDYGDKKIVLSTANTHSYDKLEMTLEQYIENTLYPQDITESGKNTLYFFGDNNHTEWKKLFEQYNMPPYKLPKKGPALSFGIAGIGSGVPFHFHGPGFAEVIHGSKRWFLYPYDDKPEFNPDETTLYWVQNEYPKLPKNDNLYECTIFPGEALYFPDRWWHATFNLETSVFISTFLG